MGVYNERKLKNLLGGVPEVPDRYTKKKRPSELAQVIEPNCTGCVICVRVCEKLAWDAIAMRPTADIEAELGIRVHDTWPPPRAGAG